MTTHGRTFELEHVAYEAEKVYGLVNVLSHAIQLALCDETTIDNLDYAAIAISDITENLRNEIISARDSAFEEIRREE